MMNVRKIQVESTDDEESIGINMYQQRDGWIGFDLDGTIAHYDEWRGEEHIGDPIPSMIELIKTYLAQGWTIKIFTARCGNGERQITIIQDWLEAQGLPRLEVTNVKDFEMKMLFDDRCHRVQINTGRIIA